MKHTEYVAGICLFVASGLTSVPSQAYEFVCTLTEKEAGITTTLHTSFDQTTHLQFLTKSDLVKFEGSVNAWSNDPIFTIRIFSYDLLQVDQSNLAETKMVPKSPLGLNLSTQMTSSSQNHFQIQCEVAKDSISIPPVKPPKPCETALSINSFSELKEFIDQCHVSTLDDLLAKLPEPYKNRYQLIYSSLSRQSGTPSYPRIVSFGESANLILGISGDKSDPHYNDLEVIEFNHLEKEFSFHKISFQGDFNQPQPPGYSKSNPAECLRCHGAHPRPNWSNYPLWPGVFGSDDVDEYDHSGKLIDAVAHEEDDLYKQYLKNSRIGRYRFLDLQNDTPIKRFGIVAWGVNPSIQSDFSGLVSEHNIEKISKEIANYPSAKPFRYALLGVANCLGPNKKGAQFSDFFEKNEKLNHGFSHFVERTCGKIANALKADVQRHIQLVGRIQGRAKYFLERMQADKYCNAADSNPRDLRYDAGTAVKYLMERLGYNTIDWSLRLDRLPYFEDGADGLDSGFETTLWKLLLDPVKDKELYGSFKAAEMQSIEKYDYDLHKYLDSNVCATLKEKSLRELQHVKTKWAVRR